MNKYEIYLGWILCSLRKQKGKVQVGIIILRVLKGYVENQSLSSFLDATRVLLELIIQ